MKFSGPKWSIEKRESGEIVLKLAQRVEDERGYTNVEAFCSATPDMPGYAALNEIYKGVERARESGEEHLADLVAEAAGK